MATKNYRIEKDSLGEVNVPKKALWGAQTQRAVDNFPISGIKMDFPFTKSYITSLGLIKDAAARANLRLKLLPANKARAISRAAKELANYYEVILRKLQTTKIKTAYSEEEIKKIMEIADEIDKRISEKEDEEGEYYPEETKVTLH